MAEIDSPTHKTSNMLTLRLHKYVFDITIGRNFMKMFLAEKQHVIIPINISTSLFRQLKMCKDNTIFHLLSSCWHSLTKLISTSCVVGSNTNL